MHHALQRGSVAVAAVAAVLVAPASPALGADVVPGAACSDGNVFTIQYEAQYPGATGAADGTYVRRVPITGGCASSWAHGDGQLSTAAIAAQCRTSIEERLGPYPITVRFKDTYVLSNRSDCISLLTGVSSGVVDPGQAPLFPGGAP